MSKETSSAPRSLWWFFGFLLLVVLIYAPVIDGKPFVDDWVYVFEDPAARIAGAFHQLHPYALYRPLPLIITAALQIAGGGSPVPVHVLQFVIHALLALLVARIALRLGASNRGAALAGVLTVVTQASAGTVGSYDTLTLSLSALLGLMSVAFMMGSPRRPLAAALLFVAALLCKESALGYPPLIMMAAVWPLNQVPDETRSDRLRRALPLLLAMGAVIISYLWWRSHLGGLAPTAGEGRYNMSFGPGIVRNLAMLWFAGLLPMSSLDVFTAVMQRHVVVVVLGVLFTGVVFALMVGGFAIRREWKPVLLALAAASVAVSPVLPLNHVSEVYAYTLVPFIALLFGESVLRLSSGGRFARVAVVAVSLVFVVNASAARRKAIEMERSGNRAERALHELVAEIATLPAGATLALRDPVFDPPDYSIFRVRGIVLVDNITLLERSGRHDVTLVRIPAGGDETSQLQTIDREVTLDGEGHVRPLSSP